MTRLAASAMYLRRGFQVSVRGIRAITDDGDGGRGTWREAIFN